MRVMTVDDSRAVRTIITKQLVGMGLEVDEAEDGQQALDKLRANAVDLILLDVTMPVMDGPTMLARLRQAGDKTPVVMLTSESKRSVIAEAMRQGIDDYILKPFKPDELIAKVRKSLKQPATGFPTPAPGAQLSAPAAQGAATAEPAADGKQPIDVLVVDDLENVIKRVRALLPQTLTVQGVTTAQAALALCREHECRVVLIDAELPDFDAGLLAQQLRMLQPKAALVSMALRTGEPPQMLEEAKKRGFSDVLLKPFTPDSMQRLAQQARPGAPSP